MFSNRERIWEKVTFKGNKGAERSISLKWNFKRERQRVCRERKWVSQRGIGRERREREEE